MLSSYHDQQHQHLQAQPRYQSLSRVYPHSISNAALIAGGLGTIIGTATAAAKNIQRVGNDEITKQTAVKNVLKEAAGTGLSTAAAAAVVKAAGTRGVLSLVGIVAVAIGAKYTWNTFAGTD
ncbi:hypothetical protein CSB45_07260 [candidate division KSB3 bacterium]|uniref:Uncharacterized protein n=1 Tax=candidate division KSB3 bacterium TaxID=2044937 RepID=A0A2G6E6C1_9BACT|nr:MAG: hypothetical protein CSB45_07260 [candidate division KSB3 bacterium]PIE29972.1 MAG: hypothetical protein CSA57_05335 [candidate division KSB3 bacterium]